MVRIIAATKCLPPNNGERDDVGLDIDRWENDGGRSLVQYKTTVITRKRIGN